MSCNWLEDISSSSVLPASQEVLTKWNWSSGTVRIKRIWKIWIPDPSFCSWNMCRALHAPVWHWIQCSEVFAPQSLSIDSSSTSWVPFSSSIYLHLHLHAVHLRPKKPPLCFYSIDYMLPVDFRHKSHFFVNIKCHAEAGPERLREFSTNDAFGRLLRSIIPNDDWHRCNKSRIFKDFISKWTWATSACSVSREKCEE